VRSLQLRIPCDLELAQGAESPLVAQPLVRGDITIGNRIAIQPMEGWEGTLSGSPTETTIRRWQRFGRSGAKLIWGNDQGASANRRLGKMVC
jgi:2,4-dienoyl-CoA reductase-like NADH-dependent reductase (Old Yellow Enzyme family)